ncbi:MAG: flagellar biosynthetic protein FliO [Selenomonadaceae bacterium]|nr:flagellar biosynthetic protein FliO [Selenomonadaceae bacterium]
MNRIRWTLLAIGIGALLVQVDPTIGWAADEAAPSGGYLSGYENVDPNPSPVSWWSTLAYLISLLAIFAFVVVLAYFAARFMGGHFSSSLSGNGGRLLESLPLGPKMSVCLVEMADRVFLLGVTEHNITLLSEITDEEEIERLRRQSLTHAVDMGMFSQQFGALSEFVQKVPPLFRKGSRK